MDKVCSHSGKCKVPTTEEKAVLDPSLPAALEALTAQLGPGCITTDPGVLDRCSVDSWPTAIKLAQLGRRPYRPDAVAVPVSADDVSTLLKWAYSRGVAVTPRGLGSSVVGQPLPSRGGLVLDLSRLTEPLKIGREDLLVTTGAGRLGSDLEEQLNEAGLTLGHSPQSLARSSVGGWVATGATGQFSSRYGGIEDLVAGLKVVLAHGEQIEMSAHPRGAVGPDLRQLFIGSEGTLGVVTEVTLRVFPISGTRSLEAFRLPSIRPGIEALRRTSQSGLRPLLLRLYDEDESGQVLGGRRDGSCVLFTGFEGPAGVAKAERRAVKSIVAEEGGTSLGPEPVEAWMQRRFDFSRIEALLAEMGGYAETIEVAHRWSRIHELYQALKLGLREVADEVVAHFSHVYPQGTSLYLILTGRAHDDDEALATLERLWATAMGHTLRLGGVITHHHGVGLAKASYVRDALGSSMTVLERVKDALDPEYVMNPGKLGLAKTRVAGTATEVPPFPSGKN